MERWALKTIVGKVKLCCSPSDYCVGCSCHCLFSTNLNFRPRKIGCLSLYNDCCNCHQRNCQLHLLLSLLVDTYLKHSYYLPHHCLRFRAVDCECFDILSYQALHGYHLVGFYRYSFQLFFLFLCDSLCYIQMIHLHPLQVHFHDHLEVWDSPVRVQSVLVDCLA